MNPLFSCSLAYLNLSFSNAARPRCCSDEATFTLSLSLPCSRLYIQCSHGLCRSHEFIRTSRWCTIVWRFVTILCENPRHLSDQERMQYTHSLRFRCKFAARCSHLHCETHLHSDQFRAHFSLHQHLLNMRNQFLPFHD